MVSKKIWERKEFWWLAGAVFLIVVLSIILIVVNIMKQNENGPSVEVSDEPSTSEVEENPDTDELIIEDGQEDTAITPEEEAAILARGVYILVNRSQNVVMVYGMGESGEYDILLKTFVASTGGVGSETPLGVFTVSDRYEALYLVGDAWGHYAVRIDGHYFFHSVPYFAKGDPHWDNLEYLEYNKLGEGASAGCVRLAVSDAKWIYEHIAAGVTVEIYDGDLPAGVVKPVPVRIDVDDGAKRGWDPTDEDTENPWRI